MPKRTAFEAPKTETSKVEILKNEAPRTEKASQSIKLGGKTFQLALSWPAVIQATNKLTLLGIRLTIADLHGWSQMDVAQLQRLLFAGMQDFHPDMTFEKTCDLITLTTAPVVQEVLAAAYLQAVKEAGANEAANG